LDEKALLSDNKALFAMAVEDALNEMGAPTLAMITTKLIQEYKCSIPDCLEHPEYLKKVLSDVFGYAAPAVVAKIKKNMGEFSQEKPIGEFLKVIAR
jgi:hypothetical protein